LVISSTQKFLRAKVARNFCVKISYQFHAKVFRDKNWGKEISYQAVRLTTLQSFNIFRGKNQLRQLQKINSTTNGATTRDCPYHEGGM